MKTDRVLTMDEYLNEWGMVPTRVESAGCDARHIPIADEKDVDLKRGTHAAVIAIAGGIPISGALDRVLPASSRNAQNRNQC